MAKPTPEILYNDGETIDRRYTIKKRRIGIYFFCILKENILKYPRGSFRRPDLKNTPPAQLNYISTCLLGIIKNNIVALRGQVLGWREYFNSVLPKSGRKKKIYSL